MSDEPETTHFGYREVPAERKAGLVGQVFDSVAEHYDLMNDLMSLGVHRLWKRFAVERAGLRAGEWVLDLAAGTGDLAARMLPRLGPRGRVVLSDCNPAMLAQGRDRLTDQGLVGNVDYVLADAETLPFADSSFDCLTIAFGLRNVTNKERALGEMCRVLRPGGRCLVLEFSHPVAPGLKPVYDAYSFSVLPILGRVVAGDAESYRYLAESIRMHPDQGSLQAMMEAAGFEQCRYHNLSGGVVALHKGYRL
jgi:demethylmenaquinone methyltransferase/2-methoxy-6-polyprenyl-1,4-benzoquinol methylase